MLNSEFTKEQKKNAKHSHNHDKRTNPTWFHSRRVDLASKIVTAVTENPPLWGGFKFNFEKATL